MCELTIDRACLFCVSHQSAAVDRMRQFEFFVSKTESCPLSSHVNALAQSCCENSLCDLGVTDSEESEINHQATFRFCDSLRNIPNLASRCWYYVSKQMKLCIRMSNRRFALLAPKMIHIQESQRQFSLMFLIAAVEGTKCFMDMMCISSPMHRRSTSTWIRRWTQLDDVLGRMKQESLHRRFTNRFGVNSSREDLDALHVVGFCVRTVFMW